MITIGIDPGLTGAISFIGQGRDAAEPICSVYDLPIICDGALSWIDGSQLRSMILTARDGPCVAVVERVSAMPKQGVASSFKFGSVLGSVLGVLGAIGIPIEFVSASKWKRELGLSSDKLACLHKARLLFPDCELHLRKHDGRAEALLIAHWSIRMTQVRAAA
jgi:hypothetical protein